MFNIWGGYHWVAPEGVEDPWINQDAAGSKALASTTRRARSIRALRTASTSGPSRGHIDDSKAGEVGMSRAYGYGATMGAWNTDYLAYWAGHDGIVRHAKSDFRSPAFEGDVTYVEGEVVDKIADSPWGFPGRPGEGQDDQPGGRDGGDRHSRSGAPGSRGRDVERQP